MSDSPVFTVADYLKQLPDNQRLVLKHLRDLIKKTVPEIDENITFDVPTFQLDGKGVLAFSAEANHCSLHLMSPASMETFRFSLKNWETSKTTVHFTPDNPLPDNLVIRMIKTRITENKSKSR